MPQQHPDQHRPLMLDTSNPLEASIERARREQYHVSVAQSGFAVIHADDTCVADALEREPAIEIARLLNAGESVNVYYEADTGGGNDEHADARDGLHAFESLTDSYHDVYARLHPLSRHDLVMAEHVPARYASQA